MLLAVISDTHIPSPTPWFERVFEDHLGPADVIVHLGDHTGAGVHHWLTAMHPDVRAVAGNMDGHPLAGELQQTLSFELEGLQIGATHGWGPRSRVPEAVRAAFKEGYDLLLFGHTHTYTWLEIDGTRLLNPGSLQQHDPSLALVELAAGKAPVARRVVPRG